MYTAIIGGTQKNGECAVPYSRGQSVILQYSLNGGKYLLLFLLLQVRNY